MRRIAGFTAAVIIALTSSSSISAAIPLPVDISASDADLTTHLARVDQDRHRLYRAAYVAHHRREWAGAAAGYLAVKSQVRPTRRSVGPTPSAASPSRTSVGAGTVWDQSATGSVNGYPCGGSLPPCYVLERESHGNPSAENPTSSASGLWQFLDSTWAEYGGYSRASHAPVSVQNAKAAALWAGGAGCSHWLACG